MNSTQAFVLVAITLLGGDPITANIEPATDRVACERRAAELRRNLDAVRLGGARMTTYCIPAAGMRLR